MLVKDNSFAFKIPNNKNLLILKNKNRFLFIWINDVYSFRLPTTKKKQYVYLSDTLKGFSVLSYHHTSHWSKLFYYNYKLFLDSIYKLSFSFMTFIGKGYKAFIKRKGLIMKFNLGYSHTVYLYTNKVQMTRLSRLKYFLLGVTSYDVRRMFKKIISWKSLNIFTTRGIRVSKQLIYKKRGKISAYR
jgi:hypothetical protein